MVGGGEVWIPSAAYLADFNKVEMLAMRAAHSLAARVCEIKPKLNICLVIIPSAFRTALAGRK